MNPLFRFMQKLGGHIDDAAAGMDPLFQKALERERRILASARADTGRQWQNLARRLENPRTLTGVTRARLRIRWAMAGAAVATIASAAIVISLLSVRDPAGATYHTARGEQSTVVLADSSQILLNHTT